MVQPIQSPLLAEIDWLEHGFGVRGSEDWPPSPERARVTQVHGDRVISVDAPREWGEADALVTAVSDVFLTIRTADCLPILVVDLQQRKVAAVHAGWRGSSQRILIKVLNELGSDPKDVRIAVGPGIGECCFEVGPEVAQQFGRAGRQCINLAQENLTQSDTLGVPRQNIWVSGACTRCDATRFHSHRREREKAGRMVSAIRIRPVLI